MSWAADEIVAEVDGATIRASEVADAIILMPEAMQKELLKPENRKKFVENLAVQRLLVNEFKRRKLEESPKFSKLMEHARNQVLFALLQDQLQSDIKIEEKEIRAFYDAHLADFRVPERRRARHILMADAKKADEVLKRIKSGAKFEAEARLHSTDKASAAEGGDIGWFEQRDLVPDFSKVVFSMKPGDVYSKAVQTRFGYHIIRLEGIQPGKMPTFAEIREEVRQRCANERRVQSVPNFIETLKEKSKIVVHDDKLSGISTPRPGK